MTTENFGGSVLNRREALQRGATGAVVLAGLAAAGRAAAQPACTTQQAQTEGPYWVDEMLSRSDIRSDPTSGVVQQGLPMRMSINVSETQGGSCSPVAGAYVDVWHCNALGVYSDVAQQGTQGQKFLRGYQATDAHGNARFLTIYPGWYQGRTVHIHFRIRKFSGTAVTFNFVSQFYFDDAITTAIFRRVAPYSTRPNRSTTNPQDGIYGQGGSQLLLRLADNGSHVVASFNAVINANPGLLGVNLTPEDPEEERIEHRDDPGGGTPPAVFLL